MSLYRGQIVPTAEYEKVLYKITTKITREEGFGYEKYPVDYAHVYSHNIEAK